MPNPAIAQRETLPAAVEWTLGRAREEAELVAVLRGG